MNTTFILHGGNISTKSPNNDNFFKEFTSHVEASAVKILMCYWARSEDKWNKLFERDTALILAQTKKEVTFKIAHEVSDVTDVNSDYDVLFVAGGDGYRIEPYYSKLKGLKGRLNNKVYIGSSMGAFLVASNYVLSFESQDSDNVHKGIGILPVNVLCHWNIEKKKDRKIELLSKDSPELPILTLDEGQYAKFCY